MSNKAFICFNGDLCTSIKVYSYAHSYFSPGKRSKERISACKISKDSKEIIPFIRINYPLAIPDNYQSHLINYNYLRDYKHGRLETTFNGFFMGEHQYLNVFSDTKNSNYNQAINDLKIGLKELKEDCSIYIMTHGVSPYEDLIIQKVKTRREVIITKFNSELLAKLIYISLPIRCRYKVKIVLQICNSDKIAKNLEKKLIQYGFRMVRVVGYSGIYVPKIAQSLFNSFDKSQRLFNLYPGRVKPRGKLKLSTSKKYMVDEVLVDAVKSAHFNDKDSIWDQQEYLVDNLDVMDHLHSILDLAEKDYNLSDDFMILIGFLSQSSNYIDLLNKIQQVLNRETLFYGSSNMRASLEVTNLLKTYHNKCYATGIIAGRLHEI